MQSRIDFLELTLSALESVEIQVGQLKAEIRDLHEDCIALNKYGIEENEELDKSIVDALSIMDELVDSFDNILAKPGDDIKTQRETDYRYSVNKTAKTVEDALKEHELVSTH